jgi:hypothetical protein
MHPPLYPRWNSPQYQLDRRLIGPQSPSGHDSEMDKKKCSGHLPRICWCLGRKTVNWNYESLLKSRKMLNQKATTLFNNLRNKLLADYTFRFVAHLRVLKKEIWVMRSSRCLCVCGAPHFNFWKGTPILTKIALAVMPLQITRSLNFKILTMVWAGLENRN